jgi:hypothetical protein
MVDFSFGESISSGCFGLILKAAIPLFFLASLATRMNDEQNVLLAGAEV